MLSIRIGFTPPVVLDYLRNASETARNVVNSSFDADKIGRYLEWAANQRRTLGSSISSADMDRLITTRTYWALVSAGGVTAIALIDIELQSCIAALETEEAELRHAHERWSRAGWTTAAVLDTNALMTNHATLLSSPWHDVIGESEMRSVRIVIPMIVIDELDTLKRSNGLMKINGKDHPRRTVARQALRTVAGIFPTADTVKAVNQSTESPDARPVTIELMADPPGHIRLENPDAEIRDRALTLAAHANRVLLVTYDLGNQFAAGLSGLEAIRLIDEEDAALPDDPLIASPRRKSTREIR